MQHHTPSSRPHWLQSHTYRHRHITPAHHHIELLPCKVWKLTRCSRPHSGTSHTHTDIITPAHHHHITPTHRAITLQGMEAMERGRDAAALTGSSGHRQTNLYDKADFFFNIQIWPPTPTSSPHHHITTTPAHRVTTLQGVEAYTMQAKRGAGSRHTSRNIGGGVSHPQRKSSRHKPPRAASGQSGCSTTTPTHRVITLQGNEAGCSRPTSSPRHIEK